MAVTVTPLEAPLGAEISGVDLSGPLDNSDFYAIHQAMLDHLVFVLSGLEADLESLVAFGRRFGGLVPHVLQQYHHPDTSEVSIISTDPKTGAGRTTDMPAGAFWHSDLSYDANPADATMLYSLEVPPKGGDTLFINMVMAYETLPEKTKARIDGLNAIHRYGYKGGKAVVDLNEDQSTRHPDVFHPVVRVHPETGKKALFVTPGFTVGISGMDEDESREILDELYAHATKPEFVYRHQWQPGQLVGCDNRATMHSATGGYDDQPRTLWRMIVGGTG